MAFAVLFALFGAGIAKALGWIPQMTASVVVILSLSWPLIYADDMPRWLRFCVLAPVILHAIQI